MSIVVEQVGGTHYGDPRTLSHWDVMEDFNVSYLEGNATKYIMRWRSKGTPVTDLGKAVSYLRKMDGRPTRRRVPPEALQELYAVKEVDPQDAFLINLILGDHYGTQSSIAEALDILQTLLMEVEKSR